MPSHKISTVASVLGVSDDTIRRWLYEGTLTAGNTASRPATVDGVSVAELLLTRPENQQKSNALQQQTIRNHLTGLVIKIIKDQVMSQVELQCGAHRIVSLVSTEAVEQLKLEVGSIAVAQIKSTNVSLLLPEKSKK